MKADIGKMETSKQAIRLRIHAPLSQSFFKLIDRFQNIQTEYKDKSREAFKRTAEIVKPGITAAELDQMIASGESQSLFSQQTLEDQKKKSSQKCSQLYTRTEERHTTTGKEHSDHS